MSFQKQEISKVTESSQHLPAVGHGAEASTMLSQLRQGEDTDVWDSLLEAPI